MVEQKSKATRTDTATVPAPIDLGILLGLAYQGFTDQLWAQLGSKGFDDLGTAYGYVFRALADDELSQRELATRLGITDQGMAKILGEMVNGGYVERRPDAGDARVKRLRLGKRGRAALAAARRFHADFEQSLAAEAGPAAVTTLRRVLELIARRGHEGDLAFARLRPT
jgi:DNA-binding MarR family transcriptional regulator